MLIKTQTGALQRAGAGVPGEYWRLCRLPLERGDPNLSADPRGACQLREGS